MVRSLLAAFAVMVTFGLAHAEKRIALVIGNSEYAALSPIANAAHDAALIARTLKSMGFEVGRAEDADLRTMDRAMQDFGKALGSAGKDAIGLFYFAGHGIQSAGTNYLLPVDAEIADESDLRVTAVSAAGIVARLAEAENALNLVILDASRDNSFQPKIRSGGKGLAAIASGRNLLVALSAAPGRIGTEGAAENSPYALALAEAIVEPGLSIEQVFEKIRARVESITAGTQSPWVSAAPNGQIYLAGPPPSTAEAETDTQTDTTVSETTETASSALPPEPDEEAEFWKAALDGKAGGVEVLETYLKRFPDGRFVPLAKMLIEADRIGSAKAPIQEREEPVEDDPPHQMSALPPPQEADPPQTAAEMVALGTALEAGNRRDKDMAKAAEWYGRASQLGSAEGDYRLALLHYRGEGVDQDYDKAAELMLQAAKAKLDEAVSALTDPNSLSERGFVRAIQERLKTLGYYRSGVDGLWGPGSRSAVLAFSRGEPVPDEKPVRRRTRPSVARSTTVRGGVRSTPPSASAQPRTNPQCARWGKDFSNPGCGFGL